jgi:hypothetical protein
MNIYSKKSFFSGYLQNVQSMVLSNEKLWVFAGYDGGKRWVLANVLANQTFVFKATILAKS